MGAPSVHSIRCCHVPNEGITAPGGLCAGVLRGATIALSATRAFSRPPPGATIATWTIPSRLPQQCWCPLAAERRSSPESRRGSAKFGVTGYSRPSASCPKRLLATERARRPAGSRVGRESALIRNLVAAHALSAMRRAYQLKLDRQQTSAGRHDRPRSFRSERQRAEEAGPARVPSEGKRLPVAIPLVLVLR